MADLTREQIDKMLAQNLLTPKTAERLGAGMGPVVDTAVPPETVSDVNQMAPPAEQQPQEQFNMFGEPITPDPRRQVLRNQQQAAEQATKEIEQNEIAAETAKVNRIAEAYNLSPEQKQDLYNQRGLNQQNVGPELPVNAENTAEASPGELVDYASQTAPLPSTQRIVDDATKGIDMQQDAITEAAKAGVAMATEQAAKEKTLLEENEKLQKTQQLQQQVRQQKITDGLADLDEQLELMSEERINPDRYWQNASTGTKILASIGLALGALAGDNTASLNMINNAINRDIDAQKADLQNKKSNIASQRGILKDMMAHYGTIDQAEDATRLAYINGAQAKIENMLTKYKNVELQSKAKQMIGQLEQQKIAIKSQMAQKFAAEQPVSPNATPEQMTPEQRKKFIPGLGVAQYGSEKSIDKFREDFTQRQIAQSNLRELMALYDESGRLPGANKERAKTIVKMLRGQMRQEIVGPGAVSDSERKIIADVIADPTDWFSLAYANRAKLEELNSIMDRSTAVQAKMYGVSTQQQRLGIGKAQ